MPESQGRPTLSTAKTRNDMGSAVPKFCHGLETHRRTQGGRVRSAHEFLGHFFPHDDKEANDRVFRFLPREVRGPILTAWGVRGQKSALRDTDDKVRSVVHDALVAGDLDSAAFEDALGAEVIIPWIDLGDWWKFWRAGKLPKYSILKAFELAYELQLFDAEWYLETLQAPTGKLRGTDVLAEGLSKADLVDWVRAIYQGGDGSARGILLALGWDQIVSKTTDEALLAALDSMALKVALVGPEARISKRPPDAKLPGVPIAPHEADEAPTPPGIAMGPPSRGSEQQLDGEAAANLFKDDEMIPISSSQWGDNDDDQEETKVLKNPSTRPGGKRQSKHPPPATGRAKG